MLEAIEESVLTVAEFTGRLKQSVEQAFPSVWIAGEISNFSRPQSGHCYFTLKDAQAQLRAVLWRGVAARLDVDLHDGVEVVCRGRIDVYPPRGTYQLVVERLQLQGLGTLELALRKLREKLEREGLFEKARKRRLPLTPRRIGVVTSPTGAAVHDFLQVLGRRWRGVTVFLFPTRVQGVEAAPEIVAAIESATRMQPPLDVLVVTRGGGSLEDLWSFNDEKVVRAIAAAKAPVVSAIGHEIDVTLSDLAADVRALTPSEAGELVAPSAKEMAELVGGLDGRLRRALRARIDGRRDRLDAMATRPVLARPLDGVRLSARRVDELSLRLHRGAAESLQHRQSRLATTAAKLEALSPLAVLGRGYSVTQDGDARAVLRSIKQVRVGQALRTRLPDGAALSRVEQLEPIEGVAKR
ncbi:MAG: exodeoxyribonuclease VII large subunit [Planctomycetota bacterium]